MDGESILVGIAVFSARPGELSLVREEESRARTIERLLLKI